MLQTLLKRDAGITKKTALFLGQWAAKRLHNLPVPVGAPRALAGPSPGFSL